MSHPNQSEDPLATGGREQPVASSAADVLAQVREAAARATTDEEVRAAAQSIRNFALELRAGQWEPYPWQHPHAHPPGWVSKFQQGEGENARYAGVCDEGCYTLPRVEIRTHGAWLELCGRGCVAGWTRVWLPEEQRHARIDVLAAAGSEVTVLSLTDTGPQPHRTDGAPFLKGWADLWEMVTEDGHRITVTDQHRFLTQQGWQPLAHVHVGQHLAAGAPAPQLTTSAAPSAWPAGGQRWWGTPGGSQVGCPRCHRCGGPLPLLGSGACPECAPSPTDAPAHSRVGQPVGARTSSAGCSPPHPPCSHPARTHSGQAGPWPPAAVALDASLPAVQALRWHPAGEPSRGTTTPADVVAAGGPHRSSRDEQPRSWPWSQDSSEGEAWPQSTEWTRIRAITHVGHLPFYDMTVPGPENYAAEGLWHHNTGKTEGAAHYVNTHMQGPPCDPRVPGGHRLTIVAPTQGDAVSSCVTGVSGLQAINPNIRLTTTREGTTVRWSNGAVGRVLGAHTAQDIDRFRAWSNICLVHVEEAAAMRLLGDVIDLLPFTLRLGGSPHSVITTTPKRDPEVQRILANPAYVRTKGRTRDAHKLDPTVREALEDQFAGTTLGQQELDAEELKEVPGALWVYHRPEQVDGIPNKDERPGIDNDRAPLGSVGWLPHQGGAEPPALQPGAVSVQRVAIGVDPAGGRTENGIVVVGSIGGHSYTLADLSLAGPPDTWARIAIAAYYDFGAEGLAAEKTYGGDMVADVIHSRDPNIPLLKVSTKVGKRLRAEPIQGLSQQHRVHMVGRHPLLENELTGWVPPKDGETAKDSPNRLDAWVHANTYLLIRSQGAASAVARGSITRPTRRA